MSRAVEDANRRLLRARDAVDRAYAEPPDVRTPARIAHVSEAHLIRTFRATFGETPNRYLQRQRVERVMFLLRATDRSVTDVCMDVGFSSPGTFSRVFRDVAGEPPSAYRRRGPFPPVPTCFAMAWARPSGAVPEKPAGDRVPWRRPMLTAITITQNYVPDQDQALDLYVGKLGVEVRSDVDVGPMRWLTVNQPGRPDRAVLLEEPGSAGMSEETAAQVRELEGKGVEVAEEPEDRGYGIDFGLRDPFGNHLRIAQVERA